MIRGLLASGWARAGLAGLAGLIVIVVAVIAVGAATGKPAAPRQLPAARPFSLSELGHPGQRVSLAALRGRPVLLFFWAHWCPDCKADVPVIAAVEKRFGPQGLTLVGPTRLYGYAAGGDPATPEAEKRYIEQIRRQYYAPLGNFAAPLSAVNFQSYGASTTPTLVLLDRAGVVRFYHPGAVSEPELAAHVQDVLR